MTSEEIAHYYEINLLGSFSKSLMELIGKADENNKTKIAIAFPEYVKAYNLWFHKPEGWDEFEKQNEDL